MQVKTDIQFSIIIPLYNSEKYIETTLNSLKEQTYKQFEVIIVDDASTDNGKEVVRKYQQQNHNLQILLFDRSPEYPKGVSGSRNYGLSLASSEWVCFLDSDDLFHPQKLELLSKYISGNSNAFQLIHHAPTDFWDGDDVLFLSVENPSLLSIEDISFQLSKKNIISTSCVCARLDLIRKYGNFDVELNGIEDYYLWLQLSKQSPWAYSGAALTAYRNRRDSLMGGRKMKHYIEQNFKLTSKVFANNIFSDIERANLENNLMKYMMNYYAIISINNYGWKDFMNGLFLLVKYGYWSVSFKLLVKHLKSLVLKKISKIFK